MTSLKKYISAIPASCILLLLVCAILNAGCARLAGGPSIVETELSITPTESIVSFSRTAQKDISELALSPEQLGNPELLEKNDALITLSSIERRSLLLAEMWHLRAQNDVDVPLQRSLERYLRAAHFAYEGIFSGACLDTTSDICADLYLAYNRSVREIARVTDAGDQPPHTDDARYIVDILGDGDTLTPHEWDVTLEEVKQVHHDALSPSASTLGAFGAACQTLQGEATDQTTTARRCAPVAFIVSFDNRTSDERSRAHLNTFDTFQHDTILLHGREVPLSTSSLAAWSQMLASTSTPPAPLSCFTGADARLPTAIFLLPPTQVVTEWSMITNSLSSDPTLSDHFNFCVLSTPLTTSTPFLPEAITGPLRILLPALEKQTPVILITQGVENDRLVKQLKQSLKEQRSSAEGGSAPTLLVIAGSLVVPTGAGSREIYSVAEPANASLSQPSALALSDIKRLLSRLADPDDGVFGSLIRSNLAAPPDITLSPVM